MREPLILILVLQSSLILLQLLAQPVPSARAFSPSLGAGPEAIASGARMKSFKLAPPVLKNNSSLALV
jgi:hypothetical protein